MNHFAIRRNAQFPKLRLNKIWWNCAAQSIARVSCNDPRISIRRRFFRGFSVESRDFPPHFNHLHEENAIYQWWEKNGYFMPKETSHEKFAICMPPPNVTGKLHMGHALFVTLQDVLIRYQRLNGLSTLWLPGTDHAGIATQIIVEKELSKEGLKRAALGRSLFEKKVWDWKDEYGSKIEDQLRCLGASCDWTRKRFTLDSQMSESVYSAFELLHEKKLIYKGNRIVNWSTKLQSAISDLEVNFSQEAGKLYYLNYQIENGDFLPIATTRPETIPADVAIAVHPSDSRFTKYIGQNCVVPFLNRRIPIIANVNVDPDFGTGCLKITPAHDSTDFEIGKEMNLPMINILDDFGRLNENAGKYCGLDRFDARDKIWQDLQEIGLAIKSEDYTISIPRSQRSGDVIEPLVRDQWFLKMKTLAKPALQALEDGQLQVYPNKFFSTFQNWLTDVHDWCISRQLWWGHRIPVWYYWKDEGNDICNEEAEGYVVARNEVDAIKLATKRANRRVRVRQEDMVLDTWFSSSLWPFASLGWPSIDSKDFKKFYPTAVLETGHDILFFWVARMLMMGIELTGQVPFKAVYLHGLVRDGRGQKMSKSLGNVLDPLEILKSHPCDALRYTLITGSTPGQDINFSMERLKANSNFVNKFWNVSKYVLSCQITNKLPDFSDLPRCSDMPLPEAWIVSSMHQVILNVTNALDKMDFCLAGELIHAFVWSDFADWYLEASKTRTHNLDSTKRDISSYVLLYCLRQICKLSHPIMPFVTEKVWSFLPSCKAPLIVSNWPSKNLEINTDSISHFKILQAIVRSIRNSRIQHSVEPGHKLAAEIFVADPILMSSLKSEVEVISQLAKLDMSNVTFNHSCKSVALSKDCIEIVVTQDVKVALPLKGFSTHQEASRLKKELLKYNNELNKIRESLLDESFLKKAPKHIIEQRLKRKAEIEKREILLNNMLDKIK